jgi:hypothetical protein
MKRLIRRADDNTNPTQQPAQQPTQDSVQDKPVQDKPDNEIKKDMSAVKTLLGRIDEASSNLKDVYYALFDNLNALYESYPDLYQEIEMTVKLPKNEDALNVVQFDNDLHGILEHFQDEQYLSSYVVPPTEQDNELEDFKPKDTEEELNNQGIEGLPEENK